MKIRLPKWTRVEWIVFWVCVLVPVCQLINSFILFETHESDLGKLFRIVSLAIVIGISYKWWNRKILSLLLFVLLSGTGVAFLNTILGSEISLVEWFVSIMKLTSPLFYVLSFSTLLSNSFVAEKVIKCIFSSWCWLLSISMIVPYILGIGNYKYEGTGYTGLFYENDELNIGLCCLFLFCLFELFKEGSVYNLSRTIFVCISLMLTGSKVSIIYLFVIILFVLSRSGKRTIEKYVRNLVLVIVGGISTIVLLSTVLKDWVSEKIAYYLIKYSWQTRNGSFLAFLTNERTDKTRYYFNHYVDLLNFQDVFLGSARKYGNNFMVEMDFIDIFLKFGILVTFGVIIACLMAFMLCIKVKGKNEEKFALLLIFAYSFMAGHVYESFFMSVMIALYISLVYRQYRKTGDKTEMFI